jgi:hypothetical protein
MKGSLCSAAEHDYGEVDGALLVVCIAACGETYHICAGHESTPFLRRIGLNGLMGDWCHCRAVSGTDGPYYGPFTLII